MVSDFGLGSWESSFGVLVFILFFLTGSGFGFSFGVAFFRNGFSAEIKAKVGSKEDRKWSK